MPVVVEGDYPNIIRKRTGLFSLDMALRDRDKIGVPLRTVMELYGYTNVGKSTLSYYLAGNLTGQGKVGICDLEMCDRDYVQHCLSVAGLDGTVNIMSTTDSKGVPRSHENLLLDNARQLYEEDYGVTILDSVGHVTPKVEQSVMLNEKEEELGQAFMGKRAKLMSQYARGLQAALRNKRRPSLAIVINHVHSVLGGYGHQTAGGENLKFTAAERIMLWPSETYWEDEKTKTNPIGFRVSGQVEKLRYGGRGRKFSFYIVPGYGVHEGASALFDCLDYGWAESKSRVKIGESTFGFLRADLLMAAYDGNTRKFRAFQEEIANQESKLLLKLVGSGNGEEAHENEPVEERGA